MGLLGMDMVTMLGSTMVNIMEVGQKVSVALRAEMW
jgi:hypothetical protein